MNSNGIHTQRCPEDPEVEKNMEFLIQSGPGDGNIQLNPDFRAPRLVNLSFVSGFDEGHDRA